MGAPPGEQLGPYRLLSPLGAGGFGEVHLALDPRKRTVAVKILHPQVAADQVALARLAREVETMRRVRGPHVAEVLDASLTGPRPYLVTRYVQGPSLATVLAEEGPLQGDDLVRLARGLATALAAIHAAGVIHRDLKPANVIMADGEPYVIDFGVASALDAASVTATGAIIGTPGYLAPEVLEGAEAGPAADVFAWGATMAYAASGVPPYGTGPAPAVAFRVVHREPDLTGVPDWLAPLVRECLSTDPAARPTADRLVARLGAEVPPPPAPARPPAPVRALDAEETRELRPGPAQSGGEERRVLEEARRRAERVRRRWVIGLGAFVALCAAAAEEHLPEASALLLSLYGVPVLIDAGIGLRNRSRPRVVVDAASLVGTVGLFAVLSAVFSPLPLLLAVGTVFVVGLAILVAG